MHILDNLELFLAEEKEPRASLNEVVLLDSIHFLSKAGRVNCSIPISEIR